MVKRTIYECTLEDGSYAILSSKVSTYKPILQLIADEGKVLTNGVETNNSVFVPIEEADSYYEIDSNEETDIDYEEIESEESSE